MIVILDLDETLVCSKKSYHTDDLDSLLIVGGETVLLRPKSTALLNKLHTRGHELVLCSFSPKVRVDAILDDAGWWDYFKLAVSQEDLNGHRKCLIPNGEFLLVEDRPRSSTLVKRKLAYFGLDIENTVPAHLDNYLVHVSAFDGDPNDDDLLDIWDELQERTT